ncbi:refilin-A [Callorhinchus milii]|uniref:Refilin A n=1 Tax=Callorhinchus milii TaxID=7868 RepID=A0A4W3J5B6_CALMI|nr:refilin-A [Callorhinchus milii]|eukprot:gi/632978544/ref/XP_007905973.1/ PREDICTED: protein FAM101A [Callorhinchus milii]
MVGQLRLGAMDQRLSWKRQQSREQVLNSGLPPTSPLFTLVNPSRDPSPLGCSSSTSHSAQTIPSPASARLRLNPVVFGESIKINLESGQEIRCISRVRYGSDLHYRDGVTYVRVPVLTRCRETVMAAADCTWRNYRSELLLEPRLRPHAYHSTAIVFPKHAKYTYRTTLTQRHATATPWFTVSVTLEAHRGDK